MFSVVVQDMNEPANLTVTLIIIIIMVRGDGQCSLTAYYSLVVAQDMNEPSDLANYTHSI